MQEKNKPLVTRPKIAIDKGVIPLSEIVNGVKDFLKPVSYQIKTEIEEVSGEPFSITLTAIIKIR